MPLKENNTILCLPGTVACLKVISSPSCGSLSSKLPHNMAMRFRAAAAIAQEVKVLQLFMYILFQYFLCISYSNIFYVYLIPIFFMYILFQYFLCIFYSNIFFCIFYSNIFFVYFIPIFFMYILFQYFLCIFYSNIFYVYFIPISFKCKYLI